MKKGLKTEETLKLPLVRSLYLYKDYYCSLVTGTLQHCCTLVFHVVESIHSGFSSVHSVAIT